MKNKFGMIITFAVMFYCAFLLADSGSVNIGAGGTTIPDQGGNTGKVLSTNGSILSWVDPSGTGSFASRALDNVTGFSSTGVPYMLSSTAMGTDASNFFYDSTNKILSLGGTGGQTTGTPRKGSIYLVNPDATSIAFGFYSENVSSTNVGGIFNGRRARAGTTAVQANDLLVQLGAQGFDGTNWSGTQGAFRCLPNETWTTSAHGTYCAAYATQGTTTTAKIAVTFSEGANGGLLGLENAAQTQAMTHQWNGSTGYNVVWPSAQGTGFVLDNGSGTLSYTLPSGDVSTSSAGVVAVQKLQGVSVSATPPTDAYVLTYNNAATQWEPRAASGGGSPGGSTKQVQFNSSGSFAGSSNFTWDGSTLAVAQGSATSFAGNVPHSLIGISTAETDGVFLSTRLNNVGGTEFGYDFSHDGAVNGDFSIVVQTPTPGKAGKRLVIKRDTRDVQLVNSKLTFTGSSSGSVGLQAAAAAGSSVFTLPAADGSSGQAVITNGSGALSFASFAINKKELTTLSGTDITNQYVCLTQIAKTDSIAFVVKGGGIQIEGASYDYSVSYTDGSCSGKTKITFLNSLATGGASALIAGDVVVAQYQY